MGNCVEVTVQAVDGRIGVRDTKNRDGAVLAIPVPAWTAFLADLKAGALH